MTKLPPPPSSDSNDVTAVLVVDPPVPETPPYIVTRPENKTVFEGENVTLECQVVDLTGKHTFIQWVKHFQVNGSWLNNDDEEESFNIRNILVRDQPLLCQKQ